MPSFPYLVARPPARFLLPRYRVSQCRLNFLCRHHSPQQPTPFLAFALVASSSCCCNVFSYRLVCNAVFLHTEFPSLPLTSCFVLLCYYRKAATRVLPATQKFNIRKFLFATRSAKDRAVRQSLPA